MSSRLDNYRLLWKVKHITLTELEIELQWLSDNGWVVSQIFQDSDAGIMFTLISYKG